MNHEETFGGLINLEEIITSYTWKRFLKTKPFLFRPFYKRKNYCMDIRWGYTDFTHETTQFKIREDIPLRGTSSNSETKKDAKNRPKNEEPSSDTKLPATGGKRNVALYYFEYANKTPIDQTYTFSTSKETTASTSVEMQETYTKGGEASIEISVPGDFLSIGAGLSGELSVTDTKSQSFEETNTWQVDTEINVKKGHRAEATMFVDERSSVADFEVQTTMSMPHGKDMPVALRKKSNNTIVYTDIITDFEPVFRPSADRHPDIVELVEAPDTERELLRYNVVLHSRGSCKSVAWKNQHVHLESHAVVEYPEENK